ncbi:hypothetical protein [Kushneria phosphatilytica]|uniref:Uncharacterized protein n=1 Tax=Kushneria phosphatilytica TaxID=657387 RepID=A0A1S1NZE9_9GAMM|nr:hypothetical protein [Kushneria phosphatilytica]OHV11165.1 hypothetical protein BH688_07510 [Kushneria phosphatilytica]QEL12266.1 hypothetical protein FY550_14715 [Kushneria phosphatilytica]
MERILEDEQPRGTLCETGALTVIRDGEVHRYERAMLLTFEEVEQLQEALASRHCAWQFQRENSQS